MRPLRRARIGLVTEGDKMEEARAMAEDAIRGYIESLQRIIYRSRPIDGEGRNPRARSQTCMSRPNYKRCGTYYYAPNRNEAPWGGARTPMKRIACYRRSSAFIGGQLILTLDPASPPNRLP